MRLCAGGVCTIHDKHTQEFSFCFVSLSSSSQYRCRVHSAHSAQRQPVGLKPARMLTVSHIECGNSLEQLTTLCHDTMSCLRTFGALPSGLHRLNRENSKIEIFQNKYRGDKRWGVFSYKNDMSQGEKSIFCQKLNRCFLFFWFLRKMIES